MEFSDLLDPELAAGLENVPVLEPIRWDDLPATRAYLEAFFAPLMASQPDSPHVTKEDLQVPGPDGAPPVRVRVYRPNGGTGDLPVLLWIHGGGMVLGTIEADDLALQQVVEAVGCVAVSVEYRLAPEAPFPAAVEDCYAALKWTFEHSIELGIDRDRIAVGGASAGGGLAASVSLVARDRGEVPIAFSWLIYPMLDDRNTTPSSYAITDARVWNRESNLNGWRAYLGVEPGSAEVPLHAAPARTEDLSGLPPTYIQVGSQDLFVDEDAEYALRLARAGVAVELHVYPGAFHGSESLVPTAALSRRMIADRTEALRRALSPAVAAVQ